MNLRELTDIAFTELIKNVEEESKRRENKKIIDDLMSSFDEATKLLATDSWSALEKLISETLTLVSFMASETKKGVK